MNSKDIDICVVSETHLKPAMPDAFVNIPGYSIFRRDGNWSALDSRCKGGIAIFARSNLDVIDCYRSDLYELLCLTFKLPSGHLLLVCGVYHPPQPTYRPSDFLQYLVHLVDNALDQHLRLTIVLGAKPTNWMQMNFVNRQDGIPWWTFQLGVLRIWIMSLQIDRTCLGNVRRFLYQ